MATPEKCYDPRDPSLTFVDKRDDLDFYCEGFQSLRARMSCGHAVTPTSLSNWCHRLLGQGKSRLVCGKSGCKVEWPFSEVCKMALLTPEEKEYFEKAMATNAASRYSDTKSCPKCKSSVVRKNPSNLRVRCILCPANKGQTYKFCWQCLKRWKGSSPRSDRCENYNCTNHSLRILKYCPEAIFTSVQGVTGCPSVRACPTCGIVVQHGSTGCKNVICPRCNKEFCFVCLRLSRTCCRTSDMYELCSSGVAPRQMSIPLWRKK